MDERGPPCAAGAARAPQTAPTARSCERGRKVGRVTGGCTRVALQLPAQHAQRPSHQLLLALATAGGRGNGLAPVNVAIASAAQQERRAASSLVDACCVPLALLLLLPHPSQQWRQIHSCNNEWQHLSKWLQAHWWMRAVCPLRCSFCASNSSCFSLLRSTAMRSMSPSTGRHRKPVRAINRKTKETS